MPYRLTLVWIIPTIWPSAIATIDSATLAVNCVVRSSPAIPLRSSAAAA
jgi:hypothetical protein